MSSLNYAFFKRLISVAGVGVAGGLTTLPALAQLNPRPSIFNEAPYVQAADEAIAPASEVSQEPGPAPMEEVPMAPEMEAMPTEASEAANGQTIVDVAASTGSFTTLMAALRAAQLDQVLEGDGPYTVFAPTDEAFAALPEGTVDELLLPENRDKLVQILTYHVVPGALTSDQLSTGEVVTAAGQPIAIAVEQDGVTVNGATVVQPDVEASNGVIHVIDQVILPPEM